MGLSLAEREVKVLVSFKELALLPRGIPDLPAQDVLDKVLKEVKKDTGVQVLPKTEKVDCRRLPIILKGRKLLVQSWVHQIKLDDREPGKKTYHSIILVLGTEGDEVLTAQAFGWLDFFLCRKVMKVRGFDNPRYLNDERTQDRSSSLNLDCAKNASPVEEAEYDLEWTPATGLRYHKTK